MARLVKTGLLSLFIATPILYVGTCAWCSKSHTDAFEAISVGDTRDAVIRRFGRPSHVERPDALFRRYATERCAEPCVERLWFENRLTLDTEAWSVELDKRGKVMEKYHWVSP